jgi:hypothetical protein
MRRPRGIKISALEEIRYYAKTFKTGTKKGMHRRSRKWIIDHYFEQTTYTSKINFEKAISAYFASQGWEFPPPTRAPGTPRRASGGRMTKREMERHPEVRRIRKETNRIVRIVDKKLAKGKK